MAKFRVIEIGTYWKEFEVEANAGDSAVNSVIGGNAELVREGNECDQFETKNLSLLITEEPK